MNLNDVALLYAALGVSWAGITTCRAAKELATCKPDAAFTYGDTIEERAAKLERIRDMLGVVSPAVGSLAIGLALLAGFVVSVFLWPLQVAKAFRKGKA